MALGSAAQAAASVINTKRQIKAAAVAQATQQQFERLQSAVRFERDMLLESVRDARRKELAELDNQLRLEASLIELRNRTLFDTYPVEEGPGHLRESLRLLAADLSELPLLVVLPRFHGSPEGHWGGLRQAIVAALRRRLASDGLVHLQTLVKPLNWPHASLYWHDLYGLPALVIQLSYFRDTLDADLGGCHLRPGAASTGDPLLSVYRHRINRPDHWTAERVARLSTAEEGAGHRFEVPQSEEEYVRLEIEVAARAVTAVVTAAVDAYHLGNSLRYPERFDRAVAQLGEQATAAEWPADLGVSLRDVADPAHHLLHVAGRYASRGLAAEAVAALRRSLAALHYPDYALLGEPYPPLAETVGLVAATDHLHRDRLATVLAAVEPLLADAGTDPNRDELAEVWDELRAAAVDAPGPPGQ